ncbi:MAG: amino acid--[acyl-carrier-protein] ligase [Reyranellaceae bacterium]
MTALVDAHRRYRDDLLKHGLLISMGVDGLYGRGALFERVVDGINRAFTALGEADRPEVMRFPPGIGTRQLERSGYLASFPHLAGTVHSFSGTDHDHRVLVEALQRGSDWAGRQHATQVALTPAACYGVYPAIAARGRLPAGGTLVDVFTWCFRHEPAIDPARMQMFRQREHVRLGTSEQVLAFRQTWMERAQTLFAALALPHEVDVANDPFFGRTGRLLAASQREQSLKFELLIPISSADHPTACVSFNFHSDQFGRAWTIATADGAIACTACVGFGVERIALALFRHHGFAPGDWPDKVRDALGL